MIDTQSACRDRYTVPHYGDVEEDAESARELSVLN